MIYLIDPAMSVNLTHVRLGRPYKYFVGVANMFRADSYLKLNGFPNNYYGWGFVLPLRLPVDCTAQADKVWSFSIFFFSMNAVVRTTTCIFERWRPVREHFSPAHSSFDSAHSFLLLVPVGGFKRAEVMDGMFHSLPHKDSRTNCGNLNWRHVRIDSMKNIHHLLSAHLPPENAQNTAWYEDLRAGGHTRMDDGLLQLQYRLLKREYVNAWGGFYWVRPPRSFMMADEDEGDGR